MRILVTGSKGFIAQNLISHLTLKEEATVDEYSRDHNPEELAEKIQNADFIFHLAGVNRPETDSEFNKVNAGLTKEICDIAATTGREIPILFTSSIQVNHEGEYGKSKLEAEKLLKSYKEKTDSNIFIFRLPNVFGKWCKPNYNSVVATFCYNLVHEIPIEIHNKNSNLDLIYIDDLVNAFIGVMSNNIESKEFYEVSPQYSITVGELSEILLSIKKNRDSLIVDGVGVGLVRALYATFLSYFEKDQFSYKVPEYNDERGRFSEILKTGNSGQFSFFTSKPGITRGKHYHHTKSEKFLVVQGLAEFNFTHIQSGEQFSIKVNSENAEIVETIPGWAHDITNIGDTELIVFLWANEVFDRENPDTYTFG